MSPVRIYFADFWDGFDVENNWFLQILRSKYHVIIDDKDPEIVIYSCYSDTFIKYKNAVKVIFLGENYRPNYLECDYSIGFDYMPNNMKNLRLPLYVIYGWDVSLQAPKNAAEIKAGKPKFCNMLVSNPKSTTRLEFFKYLNEMRRVDSGGSVLNNIGYRVKDRFSFIKDYRFTIAFENSSYPGYTTEKIFQPMKVNSIPIYWGNPKIDNEFNVNSFICVHDFSSLKEAAEFVISVDDSPEKYNKMISEPWFNNNQPNEYFDTDRFLNFFSNILKARGASKSSARYALASGSVFLRRVRNKLVAIIAKAV